MAHFLKKTYKTRFPYDNYLFSFSPILVRRQHIQITFLRYESVAG